MLSLSSIRAGVMWYQITGQGVLRVNNTLKSVLAKFQSDWMTLEKVIKLFLSFSRFDRGEVSRA